MKKIAWIDVETTGLNSEKNQIIELAILFETINEVTGESISNKKFHAYCLPEEEPKDFNIIENITGITWQFLQNNGISEKELFERLIIFLNTYIDRYNKNDKCYFVAYNSNFDQSFIRELFKRQGNNKVYFGNYFYHLCIDSLQVALFCEFLGLFDRPENFKLETVVKYLEIEDKEKNNFHSAIEDIKATRKMQNYCINKLKEWR